MLQILHFIKFEIKFFRNFIITYFTGQGSSKRSLKCLTANNLSPSAYSVLSCSILDILSLFFLRT